MQRTAAGILAAMIKPRFHNWSHGRRSRSLATQERHSVARAKSDRVDAELLPNILRTDRNAHRPLPSDSNLAQAIGVLARAHRTVWNRQHIANNCVHYRASTTQRSFKPFRIDGHTGWRTQMPAPI